MPQAIPAQTQPLARPPPAQTPPPSPNVEADFLITDKLLKNQPKYEDFETAATGTSICLGQGLVVENVSSRAGGLVGTPEASDAAIELGLVKPGGTFRLAPKEAGVFFISEPDGDGLLFRYEVKSCKGKR